TSPVTSSKSWSTDRLSESVTTNAPTTKPTPITTAKAVIRNRSLWPRTLRTATRSTSASELLHAVEHPLGGRVGHLVGDAPVDEEDDAIAVPGGHGVVGDHHDRLAELVDGVAQEAEDLG